MIESLTQIRKRRMSRRRWTKNMSKTVAGISGFHEEGITIKRVIERSSFFSIIWGHGEHPANQITLHLTNTRLKF
jgi:hypothetical protein